MKTLLHSKTSIVLLFSAVQLLHAEIQLPTITITGTRISHGFASAVRGLPARASDILASVTGDGEAVPPSLYLDPAGDTAVSLRVEAPPGKRIVIRPPANGSASLVNDLDFGVDGCSWTSLMTETATIEFEDLRGSVSFQTPGAILANSGCFFRFDTHVPTPSTISFRAAIFKFNYSLSGTERHQSFVTGTGEIRVQAQLSGNTDPGPMVFVEDASDNGQVPPVISFQGRILSGGAPFNGSGLFKFALVSGDSQSTYWRNSSDIAPADGEPDSAITLPVSKGLYAVLLGDPGIQNMSSLSVNAFQDPGLRLRVWFCDGINGFQQLTPDQRVASAPYALVAQSLVSNPVFSGVSLFDGPIRTVGNITATAFYTSSDRHAKTIGQAADPQAVLAKVAGLPIMEWSFKSEPAARHLGPMAQDFYSAFGLGAGDKQIATVDADGIALAAIQGLNLKVERLRAEADGQSARLLEEVRRENQSLRDQLRGALQRIVQIEVQVGGQ